MPININKKNISKKKYYNKCRSADLRTLVTPSGCYICPYFRGEHSKRIGDLRFETLSEMWNGKKRKEIMEKLNPSKDCSNLHCIRHETNQEIEKIIDIYNNKNTVEEKILPKKDYFI